jgi:hypothetical protein
MITARGGANRRSAPHAQMAKTPSTKGRRPKRTIAQPIIGAVAEPAR